MSRNPYILLNFLTSVYQEGYKDSRGEYEKERPLGPWHTPRPKRLALNERSKLAEILDDSLKVIIQQVVPDHPYPCQPSCGDEREEE